MYRSGFTNGRYRYIDYYNGQDSEHYLQEKVNERWKSVYGNQEHEYLTMWWAKEFIWLSNQQFIFKKPAESDPKMSAYYLAAF
ncbi:hypothetical protein PSSHI_20230 [Photobacterium sp. R1]